MAPPDSEDQPETTDSDAHSVESLLEELAPAQLLILKVLAYEGNLSSNGICEETKLPSRTVKHALSHLREESLVERCFFAGDGRVAIYSISSDVELPEKFGPEVSARDDMETREEETDS